MSSRSILATLALFAAGASSDALGAGLSTTDRSVIAMGAGGTGAARADDPGANVYNPAAAAMTPGFAGSVGAVVVKANLSASGDGWASSGSGGPVVPPLLHLRYAFDNVAFGGSLSVPFGTEVSWPSDWPGRFRLRDAKISVLRASAFAAYRIDRLAFAAGPFIDFGALQSVRTIDFVLTEGHAAIDTTATGFGLTAAVFYRLLDDLDLGLCYQSRSKLSFSGAATFDAPIEFGNITANQPLTSSMVLPDRITLGALYRVSPELDLSADLELILWGTIDRFQLEFTNPATPTVVEPRDWHTTVAPRIGATYSPHALSWLRVRGGAFLDPTPVPDNTVSPSSPDSTRIGFSAGAGFTVFSGASLDVAYQFLWLTGQSSTGDTMPGVRYGGNLHIAGASFSYRFGARSATTE